MASSLHAGVAFPYPIEVTTSHGNTYITMQGDEHRKYALTEDGYSVVQIDNLWRFLYINELGNVQASDFILEALNSRSNELESFLRTVEKGILPERAIKKEDESSTTVMRNKNHNSFVKGNRKVLVVMMQFADKKFTKTKEDFNKLFNQNGYSEDGASGSVYDYYKYVSYGQLDLHSDIVGPYTAKNKMEYYGKNIGFDSHDANPHALFEEALEAVSKDIDLSEYDSNDDGIVDNFHIIYAGYGEEAGALSDAIWAHESMFNAIMIDNVYIDRYSCAPELRLNRGEGISRIGPHCHEIGHALGAMDYYDTDYDKNGSFSGTGDWDVMASGSWNDEGINPANFNSYVKAYDFGWADVFSLDKDSAISIKPSSYSNIIFKIETPEPEEFFLLENRQKVSFDSALPGNGLLIYHIGEKLSERVKENTINSKYPQQCYIVCASSDNQVPTSLPSSYGSINTDGCSYPGTSENRSFSLTSVPAAFCNSGVPANFSLEDIMETDDGLITLSFCRGTIEDGQEVVDVSGEIVWLEDFADGITSFWRQEYFEKNVDWSSSMIYNEGFVRVAELRANGTPWDADDVFTKTALVADFNSLEEGNYVFSIDYQNDNTRGIIDSLKISVRQIGNEQWSQILRVPISSKVWSTKTCLIDHSFWPFELCIEGVVSKISRICITNLVLRKNVNTALAGRVVSNSTLGKDYIYDLSGCKILVPQKGLNIIRQKDGTVKKVFVK